MRGVFAMEPEFNDSAAPATKADIAMVLGELRAFRLEQQAEVRAFRLWAEGKFEVVEQKFETVDQRFGAFERRVEKVEAALEELSRLLGVRLTVLNVTLVGAIVGAAAWS